MKKKAEKKTPEQVVKAIFELDLEPIKIKLMDPDEGEGWTQAQADQCEIEYKRFLALGAKYPGVGLTPSVNVDKFWHAHILDTRKYAQDCQQTFGYFVHHAPHYGGRAEEDVAKLANDFSQTLRLYQKEFGGVGTSHRKGAAIVDDKAVQQAAWCTRADDKAAQQAAWCTLTEDKAAQQAAWCTLTDDKATKRRRRKSEVQTTLPSH